MLNLFTDVQIGTFIPNATANSVLFIDSNRKLAEDNANLFWDDANNRLGIGTNAPVYKLDVLSSETVVANFGNTGQADQRVYLQNSRAANVLNTTGFNYYLETSTSTRSAYGIIAQFTNITDATRTSRVDFKTADSGTFGTVMSILGNNVGIGEIAPAGRLEINTGATNVIGHIIKRVVSQTANLSEWRDESDNVLMQVNENGYIGIGIDPTTVPLYIQGTTSADSRMRMNCDGQYTGLYTYQYSDTNFHGHFQAHYRYRGSIAVKAAAAANDTILTIEGWGADSAVAVKRAGQFQCKVDSVGAGYVTGQWEWKVSDTSDTVRSKLKLKNSEIVLNEDGQDTNTRIEGATDTNLFFVDAGTDRVGIGTNAPNTLLHVDGPIATALATKVNDYTITATDSTILADATSNTVTITLPTAASITGRIYTIKCINDTFTCTVDAFGTETIDGSLTKTLILNEVIMIQSNGSNWFII